MKKIIPVLFFLPLISAVEINLNCPEKVEVNQEFICILELKQAQGIYDVKIELTDKEETIAQIYDPQKGEWKSSYYYLYDFIEQDEEKEIEIKITKNINKKLDGILKLRQDSKREFFEFEIKVENSEQEEEKQNENKETNEKQNSEDKIRINKINQSQEKQKTQNPNQEIIQLNKNENIINLNSQKQLTGKVIYESKNQKIKNYAVYGFSLFLIFVIIILLIRK